MRSAIVFVALLALLAGVSANGSARRLSQDEALAPGPAVDEALLQDIDEIEPVIAPIDISKVSTPKAAEAAAKSALEEYKKANPDAHVEVGFDVKCSIGVPYTLEQFNEHKKDIVKGIAGAAEVLPSVISGVSAAQEGEKITIQLTISTTPKLVSAVIVLVQNKPGIARGLNAGRAVGRRHLSAGTALPIVSAKDLVAPAPAVAIVIQSASVATIPVTIQASVTLDISAANFTKYKTEITNGLAKNAGVAAKDVTDVTEALAARHLLANSVTINYKVKTTIGFKATVEGKTQNGSTLKAALNKSLKSTGITIGKAIPGAVGKVILSGGSGGSGNSFKNSGRTFTVGTLFAAVAVALALAA